MSARPDPGANPGSSTRLIRPAGQSWGVLEKSRNVHVVTLRLDNKDQERWFLLTSDHHFDSVYCDRDKMRAHLDEAVNRNALVLFGGDLFDAMQGRFDKRGRKKEVRKEYVGLEAPDYTQAIVDDAAEFLEPYKDQLGVMALGNHETAFGRAHGYNLIQSLVDRLRGAGSKTVHCGGYAGWLRVVVFISGTCSLTRRIRYFHGAGGGSPVTEDMIQAQRDAATVGNADICWRGHVHRSWVNRKEIEYLSKESTIVCRGQYHVRTPGYKATHQIGGGVDGFEVEHGHGARPIGGWWLRFFKTSHQEIDFEFQEAK